MNFYLVTTMAGELWIRAARASDAYRLAFAILGDDAEITLRRDPDLGWLPNEAPPQDVPS